MLMHLLRSHIGYFVFCLKGRRNSAMMCIWNAQEDWWGYGEILSGVLYLEKRPPYPCKYDAVMRKFSLCLWVCPVHSPNWQFGDVIEWRYLHHAHENLGRCITIKQFVVVDTFSILGVNFPHLHPCLTFLGEVTAVRPGRFPLVRR